VIEGHRCHVNMLGYSGQNKAISSEQKRVQPPTNNDPCVIYVHAKFNHVTYRKGISVHEVNAFPFGSIKDKV